MRAAHNSPGNIDLLENRLGANWTAIKKARKDTADRLQELHEIFASRKSPDTSVVVFGSVARQEVTSSSDLDWILLIDGQSVPEHKEQERGIERSSIEKLYRTGKERRIWKDGGQPRPRAQYWW